MSDGVDDLTVPQLKERLLSAGMPPFALIMDMTREDLAQRLRAARADIIDQEARHIYETTIAEEAAAKTGKKGKKGKSQEDTETAIARITKEIKAEFETELGPLVINIEEEEEEKEREAESQTLTGTIQAAKFYREIAEECDLRNPDLHGAEFYNDFFYYGTMEVGVNWMEDMAAQTDPLKVFDMALALTYFCNEEPAFSQVDDGEMAGRFFHLLGRLWKSLHTGLKEKHLLEKVNWPLVQSFMIQFYKMGGSDEFNLQADDEFPDVWPVTAEEEKEPKGKKASKKSGPQSGFLAEFAPALALFKEKYQPTKERSFRFIVTPDMIHGDMGADEDGDEDGASGDGSGEQEEEPEQLDEFLRAFNKEVAKERGGKRGGKHDKDEDEPAPKKPRKK